MFWGGLGLLCLGLLSFWCSLAFSLCGLVLVGGWAWSSALMDVACWCLNGGLLGDISVSTVWRLPCCMFSVYAALMLITSKPCVVGWCCLVFLRWSLH